MAEDPIYQALEVLRGGGIILYPTDTVWGIGCDATNEQAVARIYDLKQSVNKKSMLVLLDQIDKVSLYIQKVPEVAWQLYEVADKPDSGRRDAGNPYSGSRILQQPDSQTESTARFYFGQYFGQTVPNVVQRNRKGDRRRRRSGDRPRVGRSSHRKSIVDRQGRRERRN
mgnify:CR=1 FL=1